MSFGEKWFWKNSGEDDFRGTQDSRFCSPCVRRVRGKKSGWVAGAGVAGESGMGGRGWFLAVLSPACPKVSFLEPQADL